MYWKIGRFTDHEKSVVFEEDFVIEVHCGLFSSFGQYQDFVARDELRAGFELSEREMGALVALDGDSTGVDGFFSGFRASAFDSVL